MTDAELAVLSIVAEGPIHGYDIQTVIAQRGLRAWTNIGVSSMYYVLEKLERQGLIESQDGRDTEDAARRRYRITPAGFGVLQTAVADLISTPREAAVGFELGLANLRVLRAAQIRTAFIAYRQELMSRLAQAHERQRVLKESHAPFNVDAMLDHHIAMLQAELEWIKAFIETWEAQVPPEEEAPPDAPPEEIPRMKQVILPHDPDSPHRLPTRPLARRSDPHPVPDGEPDLSIAPPAAQKDTAPASTTPRERSTPRQDDPDADDSLLAASDGDREPDPGTES
jgi:DNA-binding PadR family transcriptional regulator